MIELVRASGVTANDILEIFHILRVDISSRTMHNYVSGGERNNRSFNASLKLIGMYFFYDYSFELQCYYNNVDIKFSAHNVFFGNDLHHVRSHSKY